MADGEATSVPLWFRLLAILGLLWNLIGVAMYLQKVGMFGDPLAGLNEAELALAASVPAWVTAVFALAVFTGLAGSIALVMSNRLSRLLLLLSLAMVLAQCAWIVFMSDAMEVHGLAGIGMSGLIVVIAAGLVGLANTGLRNGWVR
jgi:hypothetical protein